MRQNAFYSELNAFCMKWATQVPGSVTTYGGPLQTEAPGFQAQFRVHQEAIFEQLLLFDLIDININGPNVIAPLLYNRMGEKPFENLLEQNALTFVVWQPVPLKSHKDGKVAATFTGRIGTTNWHYGDMIRIPNINPSARRAAFSRACPAGPCGRASSRPLR